jgi:hypothetical protein
MVLYLLKKLFLISYHITFNNFFVLNKLLKVLLFKGFIITSTYQTNTSVISELINIKKNNKGLNKLL